MKKISFHFAFIGLFAIGSVFSSYLDLFRIPDCTKWDLEWDVDDECIIGNSDMHCTRKNGYVVYCGGTCSAEYLIRATGGWFNYCYKTRSDCQAQNPAQADWACDECPVGSYQKSCYRCHCKDGIMSCRCHSPEFGDENLYLDSIKPNTLDYQDCDKEIHNCKGKLTCGPC